MSSIPKILWQTSKSHTLSAYANRWHQSWKDKNPDFAIHLFDDKGCLNFITNHFNNRIIDTYKKLPIAVMKADFWRYLVIYKHGGGYSDIDTTCKIPISTWLPADAHFIVCKEHNFYFVQWTFYSIPNHTILKYAIELICERVLDDGIDFNYKIGNSVFDTFVHYYTGPLLWTDAIIKYINELLNLNINMSNDLTSEHLILLKKHGIYIYDKKHFCGEVSKHHLASFFGPRNHGSWRKEAKAFMAPQSRIDILKTMWNMMKWQFK